MLQHDSTDKYHDDVGDESRPGVHEYADEDGHHGIGQNVDMDEHVAHQQSGEQGKEHDEGVEHGHAARLVEIVFAIEGQIECETDHEYHYIEYLTQERYAGLRTVLVAPVVFLQVRLDDIVGMLGDDFTAVDNLLALLNQSAGQWDAGDELVAAGLTACAVIRQVGRDIVVQIQTLQY